MKKIVGMLAVVVIAVGLVACSGKAPVQKASDTGQASQTGKEYHFVMIPILVQAWFDQVHSGALEAAKEIEKNMGVKIVWKYEAPAQADLQEQNQLLERAIATKPDGIAIDAIDAKASLPIMLEAKKQGIPIVTYVAIAPPGNGIPSITDNWYQEGIDEGNALLKVIGQTGKVAIIGGTPTNSAHALRLQALQDFFKKKPGIQVVAQGFDYDDPGKAQTLAAQIISAHPDLNGFAVCDAAGPVGVGLAIKEAGKVGKIKYIGIDSVPQLQELMKAGVLDLSIATKPRTYGQLCTIDLLAESMGLTVPQTYNVGFGLMTPDMVKAGTVNF
jgi:ribose transport system substrate-binding protein